MLDKKQIELIRLRAQRAKQENDLKEKKDKEKAVKDFLSLITGSCDLNSQIKTQWTDKVFDDFTKPIVIYFKFNINPDEFGITENNFSYFQDALSQYLFSLGFAYYSGNNEFDYYARHKELKKKPVAPYVDGYENDRSIFKKLLKIPASYSLFANTIYGK